MFPTNLVNERGVSMGKKVTAYNVKSLAKVNTENYIEGNLFITNRSVGILANGSIKNITGQEVDLSKYIKKEDIEKIVKKVVKEHE